jgi:hypothetical protein
MHRQKFVEVRAALDCPDALSEGQMRLLVEFVRDCMVPPETFSAPWLALKNEAWNRLRNLEASVPHMEALLLAVLNDARQPEGYRNYAVQHLGALLLDGHGGTAGVQRLQEALVETDSSIAGTALIALAHISRETRGTPRTSVEAATEAMVRSTRVAEPSHIAALQIAAEWRLGTCRSAAMQIARDRSRSVCLRMAAIRVLGLCEDARGVVALKTFLDGDPDERLRDMIRLMERDRKTRALNGN